MTDSHGWRVPPNMPPPVAVPDYARPSPPIMPPPVVAPTYLPPPPVGMPAPVPGTGATGHFPPHWTTHSPTSVGVSYPGVYRRPELSIGTAYVLWFFLGLFGAHHFYLGKVGRGVGYLFTFGWLMIGWFVDLFTLPSQLQRINFERKVGLR